MSKVLELNGVQYTNKREIIKAAIALGGMTTEKLCEIAQVDPKGLASQMTYLRLTGVYPMKGEDGVFYMGTAEDFDAKKNAGSGKAAVVLTPEQRLEKATKRETRAAAAHTTAEKRYEANKTRENELRLAIAAAELELASILLGQEQANSGTESPSAHESPTADDEDFV